MEIFWRYKLAIKITNSTGTVLNKLQSRSHISALGPDGHCTSHFKRAMCISCRPHMDVHKGEGAWLMWTGGGGQKHDFFCGRHKWMAPKLNCHSLSEVRYLVIFIPSVSCCVFRPVGHAISQFLSFFGLCFASYKHQTPPRLSRFGLAPSSSSLS